MSLKHPPLSNAQRKIHFYAGQQPRAMEPVFERMIGRIRRFRAINGGTRILDLGSGTGWVEILCARRGIQCRGIDISEEMVSYSRALANEYGVAVDIQVGDIADGGIGTQQYDVVIANSIFEHVPDWRTGLRSVFDALVPGGVLYFVTPNKLSLTSQEYHLFPLYGWLPRAWRKRLRTLLEGPEILHLGFDYNEFNYLHMGRFLRKIGFRAALDPLDFIDPADIAHAKRRAVSLCRAFRPARWLALAFARNVKFLCIK